MPPLLFLAILATMVGTAFLSGIFGMAGGLILVGVLLVIMPLPDAMALHAITQMASNGWRAWLWRRHIRWRPIGAYAVGCGVALGLWSMVVFVPPTPVALLLLGVSPFLVQLLPKGFKPDPNSAPQAATYGAACMSLMVLTGVAGPLLDRFFLGGGFERREIVATKAACQVLGHLLKLIYFSGLAAATVDPWLAGAAILASMLGTSLARRVLEAMSDLQYRVWAGRLITVIALVYVARGGWMLMTGWEGQP
ncbi:MAG TPA: sulfite exporter TauE/SafE family protein [Roseomonas sp.]|jgi:uncharacterized membrane protein YfcA